MDLFIDRIEDVQIYRNESTFNLIEADRDRMVYRSEVSSHATRSHPYLIPTVDMILVGVIYFELLSCFGGVEISKPNDAKSFDLARKFDQAFEYLESDERVLRIKSKGDSFYVVCAHLWIHEHNCQYRELFIENFNYESFPDEYIKRWIKLK